MIILNITPHMGGGVGTVVSDLVIKDIENKHVIACLEDINTEMATKLGNAGISFVDKLQYNFMKLKVLIMQSDIILVHWWDHPTLHFMIGQDLPLNKMIFWCHKNYHVPNEIVKYPDMFIGTSMVQGFNEYILSARDIEQFINIRKEKQDKFQIGYVGTVDFKKMHKNIFIMCKEIENRLKGDVQFLFAGPIGNDVKLFIEGDSGINKCDNFLFTGKIGEEEIKKVYSRIDVFGYPLRSDHYGTCEQVLGEAMASGCVPVCMNNKAEYFIIKEGQTGFLSKDEEEYIENIVHLYYKKNLLNFMANNAKQAATIRYNIKETVSNWNNRFKLLNAINKNKKKIIKEI